METLERRVIVYLVIGGILLGGLLGGGIGYAYLALRDNGDDDFGMSQEGAGAGGQFENLDELRRAMLSRDERDVRADQSVSLRSIVRPNPSDEIIYSLAPNLDVKFQHVPVKTNSFGMRSPERPVQKPANTYRIALLGDSFAFGWGVEQSKIFAQVLEDQLNEYTKGSPRVEVLNFGVPGYSTFQESAQFLESGMQFSPDAVLVYFIENDFGMPFFVRDFSQEDPNLAASVGIEGMRKKVKEGGNQDAQKRMNKLLGLANANHALIKLGAELEKQHIPLFFAINPRKQWKNDVQRLWAIRQIPNLRHIELRDGFMEIFNREQLTVKQIKLEGDAHPNAKMHSMLGTLLAAPFKQELEQRFRTPQPDSGGPASPKAE